MFFQGLIAGAGIVLMLMNFSGVCTNSCRSAYRETVAREAVRGDFEKSKRDWEIIGELIHEKKELKNDK